MSFPNLLSPHRQAGHDIDLSMFKISLFFHEKAWNPNHRKMMRFNSQNRQVRFLSTKTIQDLLSSLSHLGTAGAPQRTVLATFNDPSEKTSVNATSLQWRNPTSWNPDAALVLNFLF